MEHNTDALVRLFAAPQRSVPVLVLRPALPRASRSYYSA